MRPALLDTNALAMVLTDDPRLPSAAKGLLSDASSSLISAISFYEIGQKVRLGKWDEMAPFVPKLVEIVGNAGFSLIPLAPEHALQASVLDWPHRDPFDRMIAVVSMHEDAALISSNAAFDQLPEVSRVWA